MAKRTVSMAYNVKNKYSTIMKTEIKKILYKFLQDGISSDDAAQQVLDLFSVMHLLTEYEKFASGDNYIGSKELIDKQIKEFIEVNCA